MLTFYQRGRSVRALIAAAVLTSPCAALVSPVAAGATTACVWQVQTTPNPVADGNRLFGVSADSNTDAWAVGVYVTSNGQSPLAEHWNGKAWTLVTAAHYGPYDNGLSGVSAFSPTEAWAVGYYWNGSENEPLIERFNGKQWGVTPSPNVGGPYGGTLNSITTVSANDVWAVGSINTSNASVPNALALIEHWNGTRWSLVAAPSKGTVETVLTGISPINANDIWIGGIYAPTTPGFDQNLAEHWNGKAWTIVATPDATTNTSNNFNAIGALSSTSVFASGDYYDTHTTHFQTLAAHWNGQAWKLFGSANAGNDYTTLSGIAAVSPTEVVSVGSYIAGSEQRTYAMRWNGTASVGMVTPNIGFGAYFDAASTIPGTSDAWAAGGTLDSDQAQHQTLIERYHC